MTPEIKQRIEQIQNGIVPKGYKQTPFGIYPANWVVGKLGDYIEEYSDYDFSAYNLKGSDFGTRLDDLKEGKTDDDEQAHQMKYEFETLIRGTKFTHEFILEDCNSIEKACFRRMISLWEERPYLGGKSGTGYGKVKLDYPGVEELTDTAYLDYIHERKEEMCNLLDELVKIWK